MSIKDQFTEEQWNDMTEEEREGLLLDDDDDEEESSDDDDGLTEEDRAAAIAEKEEQEEARRQAEEDAKRQQQAQEQPQDDAARQEAEARQRQEAAAAAKKPEEEPARTPEPSPRRPLFNAPDVKDVEAKRGELDTREDDLVKKFDDGDITFAEYNQQLRAINRERTTLDKAELKAELVQESSQSQFEQSWENDLKTFFGKITDFDWNNKIRTDVLDQLLKEETKADIDAGRPVGTKHIQAAYARWQKEFGTAPVDANKPSQKPAKEKNLPPNIGRAPASEVEDADGGKWASLDRLADTDPTAFEDELERMRKSSPGEYEAYMAAG